MKRWRISPIALAGLLALVSGLGLITVDSVSGGALIQIDPTAQQQTIDAVVQTRLTQTAVMANATLVEAAVATQVAAAATAMPFHGYAPVQHNADWQPGFETINGIEMALVPAGCFRMGNDPDAGGLDMLPGVGDGGEQCFDAPFYISRYEITNAQFDQLACTAARPSYWNDPQRPREEITWFEARDCAARMGMRLPTEAEWEYAARGPDALIYPWGNDWKPDNLVWSGNSNSQTANGGSKPGGASWMGADDLAGNVWEWVSSICLDYPYDAADGRENLDDLISRRCLRGGSWNFNMDFAHASARFNASPYNGALSIGFRVCLSPLS